MLMPGIHYAVRHLPETIESLCASAVQADRLTNVARRELLHVDVVRAFQQQTFSVAVCNVAVASEMNFAKPW